MKSLLVALLCLYAVQCETRDELKSATEVDQSSPVWQTSTNSVDQSSPVWQTSTNSVDQSTSVWQTSASSVDQSTSVGQTSANSVIKPTARLVTVTSEAENRSSLQTMSTPNENTNLSGRNKTTEAPTSATHMTQTERTTRSSGTERATRSSVAETSSFPTTVKVRTGFDLMDSDSDGFLNLHEFSVLGKMLDRDGDSRISLSELSSAHTLVILHINLAPLAFRYVFYRTDEDNSGYLEFSELHHIFVLLDTNGDQRISKLEYRGISERLVAKVKDLKASQDGMGVIFRAVDINKDGRLSPIELNYLIMSSDLDYDLRSSQSEFIRMWMLNTGENESHAEAFFRFLDKNGDGFYSKISDRMKVVLSWDQNDDIMINADEFNSLFVRLAAELDRDAARYDSVGF